jgi:prevent-host-death family protein
VEAQKITATELARNLSDVLNRVRYRGERFVIERNGELIAVLEPSAKKSITLREFVEFWERLPKPDEDYWKDLEEVHKSQQVLAPPPEWP